jgi:hypothetical protein
MCFCELKQEDRCCSYCDNRLACSMVCNAVNPIYMSQCINLTFRRLESEREEEM